MSRKNKGKKAPALGVVADVAEQTAQAAELAAIAGQDRLIDPRLNPATRPTADRLRDEQQIRALEAAHSRALRRHRVADRSADDAEQALEALQLARQAMSPARSVLALHRGKRRYLRLSLAASLVLAVGSARGVEAAAQAMGAPKGTGYLAEVGLTGLITAVIAYRSHLAEHGGNPQGWQNKALYALMVVPLLVSVVANAVKAGPVGVFCAVGAAAFAGLGYIVAEQSNTAMHAQAAKVTATDEAELRAVAMGDDPFAAVQPELDDAQGEVVAEADVEPAGYDRWEDIEPAAPEPWATERPAAPQQPEQEPVGSGLAEEVTAWLAGQDRQDPPEGGVTSSPTPGDDDGPQGAAQDAPEQDPEPGHIDADQPGPVGRPEPVSRVIPAAQARRAMGASTHQRIASYMAEHPKATIPQIAKALKVSPATVKRHRRALREAGR